MQAPLCRTPVMHWHAISAPRACVVCPRGVHCFRDQELQVRGDGALRNLHTKQSSSPRHIYKKHLANKGKPRMSSRHKTTLRCPPSTPPAAAPRLLQAFRNKAQVALSPPWPHLGKFHQVQAGHRGVGLPLKFQPARQALLQDGQLHVIGVVHCRQARMGRVLCGLMQAHCRAHLASRLAKRSEAPAFQRFSLAVKGSDGSAKDPCHLTVRPPSP
jgi:hypothetical protein